MNLQWNRCLNTTTIFREFKKKTVYLPFKNFISYQYLMEQSFRCFVDQTVVDNSRQQLSLSLYILKCKTPSLQYAENIHTLQLTGMDNINWEMVRNVSVLRMFDCSFAMSESSECYFLQAKAVEFINMRDAISFEKIRFSQVSTVILIALRVENISFLGDYPSLQSLQIADCILMTENESVNINQFKTYLFLPK
jgi:hypothetical protein